MTIDWKCLAEPQDDGYDTDVIAEAAAASYGWEKKVPDGPSWLDGEVEIGHLDMPPIDYLPSAPSNHSNIILGGEFLRGWPAMYRQCQRLLNVVYPVDVTDAHPGGRPTYGCYCGTPSQSKYGKGWGEIFTSCFDIVGFVEGVVHELGHWKLHALGVHLEDWSALIANTPDELFSSPIRKDKLRPMGAVVQAQYSYLHVLESNLLLIPLLQSTASRDAYHPARDNAAVNAKRLLEGHATILEHARWTDEGQDYWAGMAAWTENLLSRVEAVLG